MSSIKTGAPVSTNTTIPSSLPVGTMVSSEPAALEPKVTSTDTNHTKATGRLPAVHPFTAPWDKEIKADSQKLAKDGQQVNADLKAIDAAAAAGNLSSVMSDVTKLESALKTQASDRSALQNVVHHAEGGSKHHSGHKHHKLTRAHGHHKLHAAHKKGPAGVKADLAKVKNDRAQIKQDASKVAEDKALEATYKKFGDHAGEKTEAAKLKHEQAALHSARTHLKADGKSLSQAREAQAKAKHEALVEDQAEVKHDRSQVAEDKALEAVYKKFGDHHDAQAEAKKLKSEEAKLKAAEHRLKAAEHHPRKVAGHHPHAGKVGEAAELKKIEALTKAIHTEKQAILADNQKLKADALAGRNITNDATQLQNALKQLSQSEKTLFQDFQALKGATHAAAK